MTRAEYSPILREKYKDNIEAFSEIERTCRKVEEHIGSHERISISVSGGSDSDCIVHLICTYFPEMLEKCRFVFVNTGLEYDATKRHLDYLEARYGIKIDRLRGKSVVWVVRKYGMPILSKYKSTRIKRYLAGQRSSWSWIFGDKVKSYHSMMFSENQKKLVTYLKENDIKISSDCCTYSKKKPLHEYHKQHGCDLAVTGERKAEGGQRAVAQSSCFMEKKTDINKFMPLFWWSDDVKAAFKKAEGIRYSDCYEVYGLRRTGCVGCPFNLNIQEDLQAMLEHEPRLFKACMSVFGRSYELMDEFKCRRKKCLPESFQLSFGFTEEGGI